MKYVINNEFGGFDIPEEVMKENNWGISYLYSEEIRTDIKLIKWVENHPNYELSVVDIPEEATDFMVNNYDGKETVYTVINGKIKEIVPKMKRRREK